MVNLFFFPFSFLGVASFEPWSMDLLPVLQEYLSKLSVRMCLFVMHNNLTMEHVYILILIIIKNTFNLYSSSYQTQRRDIKDPSAVLFGLIFQSRLPRPFSIIQ